MKEQKALQTEYLKCDEIGLNKAADIIKNGGLVAMPTETVYGLAADATNEKAVKEIFKVKGRPQDNPLIVHIASLDMWKDLVEEIPKDAQKLADAFWPGPLTIILKKKDIVPSVTTANMPTVAVRFPSHKAAQEIIKRSNKPIAAPSANLSGLPSPTNVSHCKKDLDKKIPLVLDGGECSVGIESTVISLVDEPVIYRPGEISPSQIEKVLGKRIRISKAVTNPLENNQKVMSPGMKYKHYSPKANVTLLDGDTEKYINFLNQNKGATALCFEEEKDKISNPYIVYGKKDDALSLEQGLFRALRELDDKGVKEAFIHLPKTTDEFLGVYNRMLRAAAWKVIKL